MPSNATAVYNAFVSRVQSDVLQHRYAVPRTGYRDFFLQHLQQNDPQMMQHLSYISPNSGNRLYQADVDHIVPQSIWNLLLPAPLNVPAYDCVLSNLMIRDRFSNRANDHALIQAVRKLHQQGKLTLAEQQRYVELCLELKPHALEGTPWTATGFSNLNRSQRLQMHQSAYVDIHGNHVDRYGRPR